MAAMHLRSRETIGGRRTRPQKLAEQSADFVRPGRMMIAAGSTRPPRALPSPGTGAQEICIEDVEAAATELEFAGGLHRGKLTLAKPRHDIANEWRRVPPAQLPVVFFQLPSRPRPPGESAYFAPPPLRSGSAKQAQSCFDRTTTIAKRFRPGSTRVPRVGFGVPPKRTSSDVAVDSAMTPVATRQKVREGGDAFASTRDARAPRNSRRYASTLCAESRSHSAVSRSSDSLTDISSRFRFMTAPPAS